MDPDLLNEWIITTERYDASMGTPRMGECSADHDWWDDECWYTEEEKDAMWANAHWKRLLGPLRPITQTKHEWGQAYNEEITP
jgi:hypothetical protein